MMGFVIVDFTNIESEPGILGIHIRNSHWRCSVRKGVLKNFAKFKGKHLC